MRIQETLLGGAPIRRPVAGRYFVLREAKGEIEVSGKGFQTTVLRAGDVMDMGAQLTTGAHIQIRDLTGLPQNPIVADFTVLEVRPSSSIGDELTVSTEATIEIANNNQALDAVVIAAGERKLIVAANTARKELRLQVASDQPSGVFYGDITVNSGRGGLVEVGMVDYVATQGAVYGFNAGTESVTVYALDLSRI